MGLTVAVFKPQSPPIVPNSHNLLEGMLATKAEIVQLVPLFVEVRCFSLSKCTLLILSKTWAREESSIDVLKKLKFIVYITPLLRRLST